jgi:hypothetical protein
MGVEAVAWVRPFVDQAMGRQPGCWPYPTENRWAYHGSERPENRVGQWIAGLGTKAAFPASAWIRLESPCIKSCFLPVQNSDRPM